LTGLEEAIARRGGHGSPPIQGWGKFLRADDVFFRILERGGARLQPLSGLARVRFGVKTGANDFFYINEDRQKEGGKGKRAKGEGPRENRLQALNNLASVRRGLTTGANDFFYLTRPSTQPLTPSPQPLTSVIDSNGSA